MNRETSFQKNVKYVIYMTAVACAFCQFILLFSEFDYLSGIGTVLNMFYHLAGVACPVLIFLLFFKENDDKDVYGGYLIGGQLAFGGLAGLAILIKYIGHTKNTSSFSTVLVVFLIISIVFELGTALLYFLYGMDRVTCVLPVICFFVSFILKSEVYSKVDSKLHTKVNMRTDELGNLIDTSFKGSFMSAWSFLHGIFFLVFIICVVLYIDYRFLEDVKDDPKSIFAKKTLFGTNTNEILKNEKAEALKVQAEKTETVNTVTVQNKPVGETNQLIKPVYNEMTVDTSTVNSAAGEMNIDDMLICLECGCPIDEGMTMCPECGCPIEVIKKNSGNTAALTTPNIPGSTAALVNLGIPSNMVPQADPAALKAKWTRICVFAVFSLILCIVCLIVGYQKKHDGRYDKYTRQIEIQVGFRRSFSEKRSEMRSKANSYKYGSMFYNSYMDIADEYGDMIDDCEVKIDEYKKKQNILLIYMWAFYAAALFMLIIFIIEVRRGSKLSKAITMNNMQM